MVMGQSPSMRIALINPWWQTSQVKLVLLSIMGKRQTQRQDLALRYFWFSALFEVLSTFLQGIFRASRVSFVEGLCAHKGAHPWDCTEAFRMG